MVAACHCDTPARRPRIGHADAATEPSVRHRKSLEVAGLRALRGVGGSSVCVARKRRRAALDLEPAAVARRRGVCSSVRIIGGLPEWSW